MKTNLPVQLVTKDNIHLFSKDDECRKYVIGKIESGQNIIASNCGLGQYVCSCTLGEYSQFQRIDNDTKTRIFG